MFEVTNADEVLSGGMNGTGPKPRLVTHGPYGYIQDRVKINVSEPGDYGENHIRFGQQKTYYWDPDLSCEGCSDSDKFTMINPTYVGVIRILEDLDPETDEDIGNALIKLVNQLYLGIPLEVVYLNFICIMLIIFIIF